MSRDVPRNPKSNAIGVSLMAFHKAVVSAEVQLIYYY